MESRRKYTADNLAYYHEAKDKEGFKMAKAVVSKSLSFDRGYIVSSSNISKHLKFRTPDEQSNLFATLYLLNHFTC